MKSDFLRNRGVSSWLISNQKIKVATFSIPINWNFKLCRWTSSITNSTYATTTNTATTHFGFKTISEDEKEKMVGDVFHQVASNYDFMNDVMSFGIHRCWKDTLIKTLSPEADTNLIDVAGGTGDIAFRFTQKITSKYPQSIIKAKVKVVDINSSMLLVGQSRAKSKLSSFQQNLISWEEDNAEILSKTKDSSMDAYTIAFGIRNCTHIDKVLQQAHRVLNKGGRLLILEFSHVHHPLLKIFYDNYSFNLIPLLGQLFATNKPAYQYLVESIKKFPDADQFACMIEKAGFKHVEIQSLNGGIAAIHSAVKL